MAGREVREYTNLNDPKDKKWGKGRDKIDEEDPTLFSSVLFVSRETERKRHLLETMAVRATMSRFSADPDAQEASRLPWGVTVTPFATKDENGVKPVYGSDGNLLPRCEDCYAYFNEYCELEQWAWSCSLCGTLNGVSSQAIARYSHPQSCAEMVSSFIAKVRPSTLPLSASGCVSFLRLCGVVF
ncbi:hypothetical protein Pint_31583 [Pistacia integerrima]|uniref:Uncharacterized protein n=1 Tax=Pistacia integerrima TaxID=434235 RepID=A0ACC0XP84_9ROSI|nr:hypothetical protein Pint_31583 [Pistacia integerrima]